MKKMKITEFGDTKILPMTYDNMHELLENYYDREIASERTWSEEFGEHIGQGMAFYWVDGDRVPADEGAMEWVIEEILGVETGDDFEEEVYEEDDKPYYDPQLMQFLV